MSKNEYELLMLVEGLKAKVKELEAENARLKTIYSMGTGVVKEVEDNGDTKQS